MTQFLEAQIDIGFLAANSRDTRFRANNRELGLICDQDEKCPTCVELYKLTAKFPDQIKYFLEQILTGHDSMDKESAKNLANNLGKREVFPVTREHWFFFGKIFLFVEPNNEDSFGDRLRDAIKHHHLSEDYTQWTDAEQMLLRFALS